MGSKRIIGISKIPFLEGYRPDQAAQSLCRKRRKHGHQKIEPFQWEGLFFVFVYLSAVSSCLSEGYRSGSLFSFAAIHHEKE